MVSDPLYEPLGTAVPPRHGRRWPAAAAAALLIGAAGVGAYVFHATTRLDQTVAVAPIEVKAKTAAPADNLPPPAVVAASTASPAPALSSGTTVEVQNGVKIVRFNPAATPESISIPVADPTGVALRPAPDPRVSESSRWGTLPRIGPGGVRPADVYARPVAGPVAGPVVALLLDGMGADQLATADAARRLAPAISFAFAPDTGDAVAQVGETRRAGHEVFMQITQPGAAPADAGVADSLDALHRSMSRFSGYAGLAVEGAELLPPAQAKDVAARGLVVVRAEGVDSAPGPIADLAIDAAAGAPSLAAAFDKLLGLARSQGHALARISHATAALPSLASSSERLAKAGVTLVPVTALAARTDVAATAK